ncbi:MAG TPA: hypothetical protein VFD92_18465 [Candidatus Binatia bacterium]|nr:hypothetical protein [Candidatus Binatia bacterium]
MSDAPLAIVPEAPVAEARAALARLARGLLVPGEDASLEDIERLAARETLLWLPSWATLDDHLIAAITAWLAAGERAPGGAGGGGRPAACATAPVVLVADGVEMPLPAAVVASRAGSIALAGGEPRPRAEAAVATLSAPVRRRAPDTLSEHLIAINRQTTAAARLLRDAGPSPDLGALVGPPLALLARALAGARGERRRALPRAVLEAYRGILVAAKTWELREVATEAGR